MVAPKKRLERTRHQTLWTVEAVRWEFRKHKTEYERLLATSSWTDLPVKPRAG